MNGEDKVERKCWLPFHLFTRRFWGPGQVEPSGQCSKLRVQQGDEGRVQEAGP